MTTDELLMKLPSHIGRNKFNGFYLPDNKRGGDIGFYRLRDDDGSHIWTDDMIECKIEE